MKAIVLHDIAPVETSPLRLADVPAPRPGAGEVRVRVRACAVCRTDLHVIEGDLPRAKLPIIPGHEVVGVVDELGEGCRRSAIGDRVGIAWLRHTCGSCGYCESGRENLCGDQRFTGYHAEGGYAQHAVIAEDFAYALPPELGDDVSAAPLLCAGIVGYRALKRANVPPGGRLGIYGFGSSAVLVAQVAMHQGAELYVVTRGRARQQLALEMGAKWAGETAVEMPVDVDSAIIFAPVGALVPQALSKVRRGGTLSLAGIYMTPIPELDYAASVFGERDIRSVTANTRDDGREFLAAAAAAGVRARVVPYPLSQANEALQALKADRLAGTAVLVVE